MKQHSFYIAAILLLIIIGFAYLTHRSKYTVDRELYESEKQAMEDSLEISHQREAELVRRDSMQLAQISTLESIQERYRQQTEAAMDSVDQILALDSTEALRENRRALAQLGITTSPNPFLTNYEMGWNAKFLQENYGIRLQLNNCNQTKDSLKANNQTLRELNKEKRNQFNIVDSLKTIADLNAENWKKEYEKTQVFWNDRLIIYGGVGLNYSGTNLAPGIQAGIGFRITTIKFGGL